MRRLGFALVVLSACGGAAEAELFEPGLGGADAAATAPELEPAASELRASTPAARAPRAPPEPAPAPVWRTCETDDDCELRASVCALLTVDGRGMVCRDPRSEAGETCAHDNECELGLYCRRLTTGPVYECTPSSAGLGPRGTTGERQALSCSPLAQLEVDAGCEEVTAD